MQMTKYSKNIAYNVKSMGSYCPNKYRKIMTKEKIIKLYIADLKNLVADSDAKRNRIMDLEEELEALKQGQSLPIDSVMQSCDTCKHLSTCRFWQEAPNNGATCKFYIEHVA